MSMKSVHLYIVFMELCFISSSTGNIIVKENEHWFCLVNESALYKWQQPVFEYKEYNHTDRVYDLKNKDSSGYDELTPQAEVKGQVKADEWEFLPDSVLKGVVSIYTYVLEGYCYITWKEERRNVSLIAFTENDHNRVDYPIIEQKGQIQYIHKLQGQCTWMFDNQSFVGCSQEIQDWDSSKCIFLHIKTLSVMFPGKVNVTLATGTQHFNVSKINVRVHTPS